MPMTTRSAAYYAGSHLPFLCFLAVLLLAVAFVQACGTGGGGRSELPGILTLVPADSENVSVYDFGRMRSEEPPEALRDEYDDLGGDGLEEIGVLTDELTTLVFASGDDWYLVVAEGDIDFVHVRDQLEDQDYEEDQYRGFELWEGAEWLQEAVALLEDQGRMLTGDADAVKSVLRMLDRGSGSLLDDSDSDLARALKRAGTGWISSAQEQCLGYELRSCRALGVSLRRGADDYLVEITIAALFRNEQTAESEMEELQSQLEEDSSFEFDIDDVHLDGDFVIVTASADEDDLFEDEDDLSERERPAPVAPTARRDAPTRAPDSTDDHGDSVNEATWVTVGDVVPGVLGPGGDEDYFAFAAERGQTYRIDVDLGTLGDSILAVYDSGSRLVDTDDDSGESFGSRITWTAAESGTHYAAVGGWGNTGSYTLTITPMRDAPNRRDDHGDSADEATSATVGDAVTGVLGHPGDIDYFAFTADQRQTYRIDVDLGTLEDSVAALYDADARQLDFDDDGGDSYGSRITWTASESGTHYVAVAGWGSDTGSYTLTITALDDAPDTRDDHGDSADEATFAPLGDAVIGVVGHMRDVDYFAFAAERGRTYLIDVDLGTLDDSVAALYDADSRQLEFDDDGGDSYGSRITWTATQSGTYFVAVAGWGSAGSYTLTVTATESEEAGGGPPDSPASQRYEYDGSAIVLRWDASDGADSYAVYYDNFSDSNCRLGSHGPSFCDELATELTDTHYTHADPDRVENYYWVVACNRFGCSAVDSENPARLGGPPPAAPANQRYEYDRSAIVLRWDASDGADSYTVFHDDFFDSSCRLGSHGPSFCDELATELTDTHYTHADPDSDENYYWVVACNNYGCSAIDSENPAREE